MRRRQGPSESSLRGREKDAPPLVTPLEAIARAARTFFVSSRSNGRITAPYDPRSRACTNPVLIPGGPRRSRHRPRAGAAPPRSMAQWSLIRLPITAERPSRRTAARRRAVRELDGSGGRVRDPAWRSRPSGRASPRGKLLVVLVRSTEAGSFIAGRVILSGHSRAITSHT